MDPGDSARFISTYLDSPIIQNERDAFLNNVLKTRAGDTKGLSPRDKRKLNDILKIVGVDDVLPLDPDMYPSLDSELRPEDCSDIIKEAHLMAKIVFNQASDGARKWGSPSGLGIGLIQEEDIDNETVSFFSKMVQLEKIVQTIAVLRSAGNKGLCRIRSGNLFYLGDEYFGVIKLDSVSAWYVVSYTQVLMLKDMYYSRFNALVAAQQVYKSDSLNRSIKDCLAWFFKCLAVYGNKGYEIGKGIEPLAKANLIRCSDPILGQGGSYEIQREGIRAKERAMGKTKDFLVDELDDILRRDRSLPHAVELFGLQKLSGHPLIDPAVGGKSVREESKKKIRYSYSNVRRLRNSWCRLYLEGYIRKERQWPPLSFRKEAKSTKLYQLYSLNELKINRTSYPLSDWEHVQFGKHHDLECFPNFTDLMDDKAISLYRDEAAATWDRRMKTRGHQRLLLEMMSRPEINIASIIDQVRLGNIPHSWLIVSLYPKEREFKLAARMFSMMVFEMRAYFAATEANLAEKIFPYLPQQTMTLQKQEIEEMFHKVTTAASGEDIERLYLEIDLTRWNLRWHPEVIDPIGNDLNDIFGMAGVYTAVHHFFKRCMILIRVPACKPEGIETPNPPESNLLFYDHEVGFEGIAQKLWTIATYAMIDLGAGSLVSLYYLIGQADNQIILMTIDCSGVSDKVSHIRAIAQQTKVNIEEECRKVGQEAKPDECLESTTVVTYSKNVFIRGVEHYTSVKAYSRVFPHASSDFPSLDGSMGSLSSQCLAGAERSKNPLNGFALWCFHASLYLHRVNRHTFVESYTARFGELRVLSRRQIYGLLILPGDLGGTQIAPVTAFFYKGGADPLSKAYSSLKFYQDSSPLCRKFIYSLKTGAWFDTRANLDRLLDDPYSIPISRPTTPENSIFQSAKQRVSGISANREIKELTDSQVSDYEADVRTILKSCRPFNPVLLSDILGWSVVGAQDMISRMFTSTRTVQEIIQSDKDLGICMRILSTGAGHFLNTIVRIQLTVTGESQITSVYDDIEKMRSYWGQADGVQVAGVTSYVPFDLPLSIGLDSYSGPSFRSLAKPLRSNDHFHERGSEDPYIGRATVEKRSEHGYRIITSSAPERAAKRLADIATQPGVSISFRRLITEIAKSRVDADLSSVYPLIGTAVGGTIAHRYASRLGMRSANGLGSMSFASTCCLMNDYADPISGGEDDVPIMVQEIMVAEICVLSLNRQITSGPLYCSIRTDSTQWKTLADDNIEVGVPVILHTPFLAGNRLATASALHLQRAYGPRISPFTSVIPDVGSYGHPVRSAARRVLGRALEGSHSALAIADLGTGTIRFKIDILEARGLGLKTLIEIAAEEIALTCIESLFSRSISELRWTPVPLITTLSDAVARSLISIFLHPIFKDDPLVTRKIRPSHLAYNFAGKTSSLRLRDHIAQRTLSLFKDPSSEVFIGKEILYSDDKERLTSRIVVRRLKAILLQGLLTGQLERPTATGIFRKIIPQALRSETTESGKLNSLHRVCVTLSTWARENSLVFLTQHLRSLHEGKRILLCRISALETLRTARQLSPPPVPRERILVKLAPMCSPWDISELPVSLEGAEAPFGAQFADKSSRNQSYTLFDMHRLKGRIYGNDSTAAYSYWPISSMFGDRVCVSVGCGYGSGARVMLHAGASMVFGLDLKRDYSDDSALRQIGLPPALMGTSAVSKFVRIPTTSTDTGDIRRASAAHLINRHTASGSLYVIDVPIYSPQDLSDILSSCTVLPHVSQIMIRLIIDNESLSRVIATILASAIPLRVHPVYCEPAWSEVWIEIKIGPTVRLKGARIIGGLEVHSFHFNHQGIQIIGGSRDQLLRSIEGPLFGLTDMDITDAALGLNQLLDLSIGDLDHRFTYRQWTEVIHILLLRRILLYPDPIQMAHLALHSDMHTLNVGGHSIPIAITDSVRRALQKDLPRLCDS